MVSTYSHQKERRKKMMRQLSIGWMIITTALMLFSGCRRPVEADFFLTAKIPVVVHWDTAGFNIKNATVMVYKQDSSLYLEKSFASEPTLAKTNIDLAVGSYTVIVFNEKRNQIDYVRMRGHQNLHTFEAYVTKAEFVYTTDTIVGDAKISAQPGMLAVWKGTLTVTPEMVSYSRGLRDNVSPDVVASVQALSNIHLEAKTVELTITAHIKGLNNARMPALAELHNLAEGYHFATDKNTMVPVTIQFLMNNRTYDQGSTKDGTISQTIYTMGLPGDRSSVSDLPYPIRFHLLFHLVDKERTEIQYWEDITSAIQIYQDADQPIAIDIKVNMETPLPDVVPEEEDSGLESDVIDWKGEYIDIVL